MQGCKTDNSLPRFVTQKPDGKYTAQVNRRDFRFFKAGFSDPLSAHRCAVRQLQAAGQPTRALRSRPRACEMSAIERRDRRNVDEFRAAVEAARAKRFVHVWNCCGCGAEYPLRAKPEQCRKCNGSQFEHAASRRRTAEVA
jgi:rubrerythrin